MTSNNRQVVTAKWLSERGGLHDARVRRLQRTGSVVEIHLNDEWSNERGLGLPEGAAPGALIIDSPIVLQGDPDAMSGGWISEVQLAEGQLHLAFCDRAPIVLGTTSVAWASVD